MSSTVTIDKAGRIVLPKAVRDGLHIAAGDTLELDVADDQVTLRPKRNTFPLRKERGVWVLHTGEPLPSGETRELLQKQRNQRIQSSVRHEK